MTKQENLNVYKLQSPITFEEQEITELTLQFEDLTGQDLLQCGRMAQVISPQEMSIIKSFSMPYQVAVAAKAAKVPAELIQALKAKDFTQLTQRTQNFLTGQE